MVLEEDENWNKEEDVDVIHELFSKSIAESDVGEVVIIAKRKRGGDAIVNLKGDLIGKKARKMPC